MVPGSTTYRPDGHASRCLPFVSLVSGAVFGTWREQTHFTQRIESRAGLLLNRGKFEAKMALTAAKPRRLRPIFTFDVIDHGALAPSQQRRNHQADAFATPGWRERENVLWPVVAEIAQAMSALPAPPTDIHAVLCGEKAGIPDILFVGPPGGAVEIFCVLRQLASTAPGEHEEDSDAQETPRENDHLALEKWPANLLILPGAIAPSPRDPGERLVDAT